MPSSSISLGGGAASVTLAVLGEHARQLERADRRPGHDAADRLAVTTTSTRVTRAPDASAEQAREVARPRRAAAGRPASIDAPQRRGSTRLPIISSSGWLCVDLAAAEHALQQLAHGVDREELAVVDVEHVAELDRHGAEALRAVRRGHEHVARRHAAPPRAAARRGPRGARAPRAGSPCRRAVVEREAPAVVALGAHARAAARASTYSSTTSSPRAVEAAVGERLAVAAQPAAEVEDAAARRARRRTPRARGRPATSGRRRGTTSACRAGRGACRRGQALLAHRTPRTTSRLGGLMRRRGGVQRRRRARTSSDDGARRAAATGRRHRRGGDRRGQQRAQTREEAEVASHEADRAGEDHELGGDGHDGGRHDAIERHEQRGSGPTLKTSAVTLSQSALSCRSWRPARSRRPR